ncbi:DUF6867 family protein [Microvirga flavescens]|uniref:DUF6867 family protein n=1 Tax=Microvirga flavescens TaxID=2249811 RepID=UPI000DD85BED|nr:hypothetical protein [Microvirga flavescens]
MQGILYEEQSIWLFLFITVILGGSAAWMTGRAIALTWRPRWQSIVYLLILGAAVRFIHFALFQGTLLSPHYYAVDTIVLIIIGSLSFQQTRARQMTTQYRWLYERAGPFSWREKVSHPNG